ncbi:MAG: Ig-like domain-containing protein [Oscillospiraceae bacterium]
MSMYKCPVCGELFSTSYKKCPFCEEDDLMRDRRKRSNHRQNGRRRRNEPRAVGPILIVVFLLLVALVVYLLAGDKLFGGKDPDAEGNEPPVSSAVDGEGEGGGQDGTAVTPLSLDRSDAELEVGDTVTLTALEGTGEYSWSTSDASVATVEAGVVQAVGEGSATITVTDGETAATCTVTVKSVPLTLSTNDVSIAVGESFTLRAEGGSSFTFTSDDESVATVTADGVVTGKAKGRANITVSNGSSTETCIVRVVR